MRATEEAKTATASCGETTPAAEVGAGAGASVAMELPARKAAETRAERQIARFLTPKAAISTRTRSRWKRRPWWR